jgi:hypothetical protein
LGAGLLCDGDSSSCCCGAGSCARAAGAKNARSAKANPHETVKRDLPANVFIIENLKLKLRVNVGERSLFSGRINFKNTLRENASTD